MFADRNEKLLKGFAQSAGIAAEWWVEQLRTEQKGLFGIPKSSPLDEPTLCTDTTRLNMFRDRLQGLIMKSVRARLDDVRVSGLTVQWGRSPDDSLRTALISSGISTHERRGPQAFTMIFTDRVEIWIAEGRRPHETMKNPDYNQDQVQDWTESLRPSKQPPE